MIPPLAGGIFLVYNIPMQTATLPEIQIITEQESEFEPLYRVIIHNDDVTPMNVVVNVLEQIFMLGMDRAMDIMYTAHFKGSAYVQTLPRSEAEKRIQQAHLAGAMLGFPLTFSTEPE